MPSDQTSKQPPPPNGADGRRLNAMTVDVEDYFQVWAFSDQVRLEDWPNYPCRVERNMDRVLALFDEQGVKATFFTLGWVAERYPQIMRRIADEGHELASHGFQHIKVNEQDPEEFRADVRKTKDLLEDLSGQPIKGYRAASFSIGEKTPWAAQILADEGYVYSSSIHPIRHDHYGDSQAPRFPHRPLQDHHLVEIPITTLNLFQRHFPCAGGGYFRLLPYGYVRWALQRVNRLEGQPCIFYFHPWEVDPEQPRFEGVPFKTRFRHYTNLGRMEGRLRAILKDFAWGRVDQVYLDGAGADS